MGRRGPKPQPTVLKLARGNPGKRPLNHDEPELPPATDAELPPAAPEQPDPAALTGRALEEYQRLRPILTDAGVLTAGDEFAFETYCRLVGEVHELEVKCAKLSIEDAHRLGYPNLLFKLRGQAKQYAAELGLTPASRSGVKVAPSVRRQRAEAVDVNEDKRRKHFGKRGRTA